MNYFIAVVMFLGLLMMVNIEKFKAPSTEPTVYSNPEVAPIKTQEYSQEPLETSQNTTYEQPKAEIYKCKNSSGSIVYSESKCPSNTIGNPIVIVPNVIDSAELRRQIASNRNETQIITTNIPESNADVMSAFKKETRIRELNIDIGDTMAFGEKRADARNELSYLKVANPKELSYELELQRRNWKVVLSDFDRQKRGNALSQLALIYTNYR